MVRRPERPRRDQPRVATEQAGCRQHLGDLQRLVPRKAPAAAPQAAAPAWSCPRPVGRSAADGAPRPPRSPTRAAPAAGRARRRGPRPRRAPPRAGSRRVRPACPCRPATPPPAPGCRHRRPARRGPAPPRRGCRVAPAAAPPRPAWPPAPLGARLGPGAGPAQPQLPHRPQPRKRPGGHQPGGGQQPDGDRHVEAGAVLGQVGWGQRDGDAPVRPVAPGVAEGRADPVTGLERCRVVKAGHGHGGKPFGEVDLHADGIAGNPDEGRGGKLRKHGRCSFLARAGLAVGLPVRLGAVPGSPAPERPAAGRPGRDGSTGPSAAREERTGLAGAGVALRWDDAGRQPLRCPGQNPTLTAAPSWLPAGWVIAAPSPVRWSRCRGSSSRLGRMRRSARSPCWVGGHRLLGQPRLPCLLDEARQLRAGVLVGPVHRHRGVALGLHDQHVHDWRFASTRGDLAVTVRSATPPPVRFGMGALEEAAVLHHEPLVEVAQRRKVGLGPKPL